MDVQKCWQKSFNKIRLMLVTKSSKETIDLFDQLQLKYAFFSDNNFTFYFMLNGELVLLKHSKFQLLMKKNEEVIFHYFSNDFLESDFDFILEDYKVIYDMFHSIYSDNLILAKEIQDFYEPKIYENFKRKYFGQVFNEKTFSKYKKEYIRSIVGAK